MHSRYRGLPIPSVAVNYSDALELTLIRPFPIFLTTCKTNYINRL
jgi:hypothetical protein